MGPPIRIGSPYAPEEREADRIADILTAPEEPALPVCAACAVGGEPCEACGGGDGGGVLRRQVAAGGDGGSGGEMVAPPSVHRVLSEPGEPLPTGIRGKFERRLGVDLEEVRVHTGHDAEAAARDLQAKAFAVGPHITFSGSPPPTDTAEWERVQAHEVAHTLQRGSPELRRLRDPGIEADAKDYANGKTDQLPAPTPVVPADVYGKVQAIVGTKEGEGYWWVGPLDECVLEALWASLGDQVLTDLAQSDKRTLWDRSIKKGAKLHKIEAIQKIQRQFIGEVAGIARGFLDKNKATAEGEKAALNADSGSAPSPQQQAALTERRQASENIMRARMGQAALTMLTVGYDRLPGRYAMVRSECHPIANEEGNRNLAVKPFNPMFPPMLAPRGDECIPMPTHAATLLIWKKLEAVQEGEMRRFPSLYALVRDLGEENVATSKSSVSDEAARRQMLEAMDKVIAKITETYPRLEGHLPYELHPIHRMLFGKPPWDKGIQRETAYALVKEYEDAEFWRGMGLATLQLALFVVATLETGGAAVVALGAAGMIGADQAANSIRKWEELDAANRTNLSDETALVASGQVGGALFAAMLDTAFAFLDAYQAVKGGATAARGVRGVVEASPATLEAATEVEAKVLAEEGAKLAEKAAPDLGKRLVTPGAARVVEDEALRRAGYRLEVEVEQEGEKHIFRRRTDGTWCRFSVRVCGLNMGPEVERAAEALLRQAEKPEAVALVKGAVEGTAHEAPKLLKPQRIIELVGRLGGEFPVIKNLTPGAMERIVRAGFARAEGGGLRRALRWQGAVRGQLLEEIAAARIRGLLGKAEGRALLGLEKETGELIFIEGSRIRDMAGAQLTDGVIARRIGDSIEIVAVLESKAGAWAAGGLSEGLQGLNRMSLEEIVEGLRAGGALKAVRKLDPSLPADLAAKHTETLGDTARQALREKLMGAMDRLPESKLKGLKKMMQTGAGQIASVVERLDNKVSLMIHDGSGKAVQVTADIPKRPRFLGAVPSNLPEKDMADIAKSLADQHYSFGWLNLGDLAIIEKDLKKLARAIINDVGEEFETTANNVAKQVGSATQ